MDASAKGETKVKVADKPGKIDTILEKLISRKLAVLVLATILLSYGLIDPTLWGQITAAYLGTQGLVDIVQKWKQS